MQSYPINLFGGGSQTFSTAARRFIYESGQTDPIGGDARVIVKPDTGNEIVLRPGQAFGLAPGETAANWYVRPFDPTARITGTAIIGSGDFSDGTFKVDSSTGVIAVRPEGGFQIVNTAANRVPVALDPLTEKAMKEFPIVSYTNYKNAITPSNPGDFVVVVTAAENVRGVILESAHQAGGIQLNAKETKPISKYDGDVLCWDVHHVNSSGDGWRRLEVKAGKAVWACSAGNASMVGLCYTVL